MCIAVPMRIVELDYPMAVCEAMGVRRRVNLMLLDEDSVKVGDYVVVHVGTAIEVIREKEAKQIWELFDQLLEDGGARGEHSHEPDRDDLKDSGGEFGKEGA